MKFAKIVKPLQGIICISRRSIPTFCVLFSTLLAMGQASVPNVIPPSPEASAIGKYIDTPTDYFSGLPQISIPLFEAKSGMLSVPISLTYHAGGVKVEEVSSRVGLGWSLSAGGMVSRSVLGLPDDLIRGFHNTTHTVEEFENAPPGPGPGSKYDLSEDALDQLIDYEPDIFFFSYPGGSGKFIIDANEEVVHLTTSDSRIEYFEGSQGIYKFKITDDKGLVYHFGQYLTQAYDSTGFTFSYTEGQDGIPAQHPEKRFYNAWHLLAIESAVDDSKITFGYTTRQVSNYLRGGQQHNFSVSEQCTSITNGITSSYMLNETYESVLTSIQADNALILFDYDSVEREDKKGDYSLVQVRNTYNGITYELDQDYFVCSDESTAISPISGYDKKYLTHRLALHGLKKWNSTHTEYEEHNFEYVETPNMPNRFSFAQDVWGYYNGQDANTRLLPTHFFDETSGSTPTNEVINYLWGADRRTDPTFSKSLSLELVTYPTGGKTVYEFEPNGVYFGNSDALYCNTYFAVEEDVFVDFYYQQGYSKTFQQNFTVGSEHVDQILHFTYDVYGCEEEEQGGIPYCGLEVVLSGSGYSRSLSLQDDVYFRVPEGTYTLSITVVESVPAGDIVSSAIAKMEAFVNSSPNADKDEFQVGGLRIKSIDSYADSSPEPVLSREYTYLNMDSISSSGMLATQDWVFYDGNVTCGTISDFSKVQYSESQASALGAGSSGVGYREVQEYTVNPDLPLNTAKENGYTSYKFDWYYDRSNSSEAWPYPPYEEISWARGNLLDSRVYSTIGTNDYEIKQNVSNSYHYNLSGADSMYREVKGIKIRKHGIYHKKYGYYNVVSGANHKTLSVKTQYEDDTELSESTQYEYNKRYLRPDRIITTNSRNDSLITEINYTYDANSISELSPTEKNTLLSMYTTANMINVPVLTVQKKKNEIISKDLSIYEQNGSNYQQVKFKTWDRSTNSFEDEIEIDYTADGKHSQVIQKDGTIVSYLWGYNKTYPVAKIINASHSAVTSVLGSSISQIEGPPLSDQSLRGLLAPLRSSLPDAQITVYTYYPGVGISSVTDPNGKLTSYEYDSNKRLKLVKDHDGNILKKVEYNVNNN